MKSHIQNSTNHFFWDNVIARSHIAPLHSYRRFLSKLCLLYWMASKLPRLLDTASKFTLFSVSGVKNKTLIRKQTYMKTETRKLYSGVFWIFLPNFIRIDPYNFEPYRFKFGAFFETQCRVRYVIGRQTDKYHKTEHFRWWNLLDDMCKTGGSSFWSSLT